MNKEKVRKLLLMLESGRRQKARWPCAARMWRSKNITIIGIEGGKTAPPGTTKEYVVAYLGKCVATESVERPFAYLMPASYVKVRENLARHGILAEELAADTELTVETYRVDRIIAAAKEFQKHMLVIAEVMTAGATKVTAPTGTIVVRCAQPFGTLAAYVLEPQSEDGLCAWNFFDEGLKQGADYPVLRLPVAAALVTRAAE